MIKKYKKYFISGLVLLSYIILGLFFLKSSKINKLELLKNTDEIESLRSRVLLQSHYSGFFKFSEDYNMDLINEDSKHVVDVFSGLTSVLYISSNQCTSCIDDAIDKMESQIMKYPNLENVIISNGFALRELKLMKTSRNIKAPIYSITNNKISFFNKMDKALFPYYFTVNSNLEVSNIFFPIKSSSILEEQYFKQLSHIK